MQPLCKDHDQVRREYEESYTELGALRNKWAKEGKSLRAIFLSIDYCRDVLLRDLETKAGKEAVAALLKQTEVYKAVLRRDSKNKEKEAVLGTMREITTAFSPSSQDPTADLER
jgi:hypothetical protein